MDAANDIVEGHSALQDKLEQVIQKDKQNDPVLRNTLINKRDSLIYQIQDKEKEYAKQTLLEKKLVEKQHIRDLSNLRLEIDKRSTYSRFK